LPPSLSTSKLRERLAEELRDHAELRWRIQGLGRGAAAWVAARLLEQVERPALVITSTPAVAESMVADLAALIGETGQAAFLERRVHLFAAPEAPPLEMVSPSTEVIAARTAALYQLAAMKAPVVVASVEALALRSAPLASLRDSTLYLLPGDELELEQARATLGELGYRRTGSVEETGEYAVRGGIVDLWPPGGAYPCRLELFGDEIESMRFFDPADQRSFNETEELAVLPVTPFSLRQMASAEARAAVAERAEELLLPSGERRLLDDAMKAARPFPGYELMLPATCSHTEWMADALPADAVTVVLDPPSVEQALEEQVDKLVEAAEVARAAGGFFPEPRTLYADRGELHELLARRPLLELDLSETLESSGSPGDRNWKLESSGNAIITSARAQMRAGRARQGFAPVARELVAARASGSSVIVTASDHAQAGRVEHLLELEGVEGVARFETLVEALEGDREQLKIVEAHLEYGFRMPADGLVLVTDEEIFGQKRQHRRHRRVSRARAMTALAQLEPGGFMVHVDHGIGLYRGLKHITVAGSEGDFLHLEYAGGDRLYLPVDRINLVEKFSGAGTSGPQLDRLGATSWQRTTKRARESVMVMAAELLEVEAWRSVHTRPCFVEPGADFEEFEARFPFEETEGQAQAIRDVVDDLQREVPMDRLVCGDVGFGKTEVAMRAAYLVAMGGRQVAILVPTTVLARQHYDTLRERFKDYPLRIGMVSRLGSKAENALVLEQLAAGTMDLVVGTHRLLQKDVHFARLGMLVVDEEHRFGVSAKEKLKRLRKEVDVLTLSATPIPRTLQMAMGGVRNLSLIETAPVDRLAVRTYVSRKDDGLIRQAVLRELGRGGQVFYVHNRVSSIAAVARRLEELVPEARVAVAHGQMNEHELERVMVDFVAGDTNLLLCTSIIESGLDIPNANTMLINRADTFGLSQLYQLRGRVGRSHRRAYAYLMISGEKPVTEEAARRLDVLKDLDELGSGFRVAAHDMEIRGAGNLLGREQSGHMMAIGFDLYMRMMEEAVQELRGQQVGPSVEPEIDLGAEAYLPESYIEDVGERLLVYKRLANASGRHEIEAMSEEMADRFGPLPDPADNLLRVMALRPALKKLAVVRLKAGAGVVTVRLHQDSPVDSSALVAMVADEPQAFRLKPDGLLSARLEGGGWTETVDEIEKLLEKLLSLVDADVQATGDKPGSQDPGDRPVGGDGDGGGDGSKHRSAADLGRG